MRLSIRPKPMATFGPVRGPSTVARRLSHLQIDRQRRPRAAAGGFDFELDGASGAQEANFRRAS